MNLVKPEITKAYKVLRKQRALHRLQASKETDDSSTTVDFIKEVTSKAVVDFDVSDVTSTTTISETNSVTTKKKTVSFASKGNESSNELAPSQIVVDECHNSDTDNVKDADNWKGITDTGRKTKKQT